MTEEEADKLLLTLDPLAATAESDTERIKVLLVQVRTDSDAVQEPLRRTAGECLWEALHPSELREAVIAPDSAAELREKWNTAAGQLWGIGPHRLLSGDSREVRTLERLFEAGGGFRLIVTDTPDGIDYAFKNRYLNRTDRDNRIQRPIENDSLSPVEVKALFKTSLKRALFFAEPGPFVTQRCPGPLLPYYIAALEGSGLSFKHLLIWAKQRFVIGMSDYQAAFEPILYGWLENAAHYFIDDRTQS